MSAVDFGCWILDECECEGEREREREVMALLSITLVARWPL